MLMFTMSGDIGNDPMNVTAPVGTGQLQTGN